MASSRCHIQGRDSYDFYLFIFQEMCSLSLRINVHMKHAYKMFYNVIDYGITDW